MKHALARFIKNNLSLSVSHFISINPHRTNTTTKEKENKKGWTFCLNIAPAKNYLILIQQQQN